MARDRNIFDVLAEIYLVSHVEVRDMLTSVLLNSARSVPLLIPTNPPELCLWQFRRLIKNWQEEGDQDKKDVKSIKFREERLWDFAMPIVSFVKVGDFKFGKEISINKAFFDNNFQVFLDSRSTGGQQPLQHNGLIDITWLGP
jgi:hypothetical protein